MSGGVVVFVLLVAGAVFMLMQGLMVPAFGDHRRDRKLLKRRLASIEQELGGKSAAQLGTRRSSCASFRRCNARSRVCPAWIGWRR